MSLELRIWTIISCLALKYDNYNICDIFFTVLMNTCEVLIYLSIWTKYLVTCSPTFCRFVLRGKKSRRLRLSPGRRIKMRRWSRISSLTWSVLLSFSCYHFSNIVFCLKNIWFICLSTCMYCLHFVSPCPYTVSSFPSMFVPCLYFLHCTYTVYIFSPRTHSVYTLSPYTH